MIRPARTLLAVLPLVTLLGVAGPAQAEPAAGTCETVAAPQVPGATITGVTGVVRRDHEVPSFPGGPPITGIPDFCEVTVTLTHPGAGDHVTVEIWLPLDTWSGRFQGTGGGGYAVGFGDPLLAAAVQTGYAAAASDGGLGTDSVDPSSWALAPNIDQLFTNFASRSVHDLTVAGKAVTAWFYGRPADYSYWNGCSGGGRQGLMEAQRYPHDYDGIHAGTPAINWDRILPAAQWPQVVLHQENNLPTQCELEAFSAAAIAACDRLDRVADGIIGDPSACRYDPRSLVGTKVLCDDRELTISRADAEVVAKIWDGPRTRSGQRLWYGLPRSAPFSHVAGTETAPDGTVTAVPFPLADNWVRYFLKRDADFDTTTVTYGDFERLFAQSRAEYAGTIGTDEANLSAFRRSGGKMITWHGLTDEIIFPGGTIQYRERVERAMGGAARVDEFYRVFLAPGVEHCGEGPGPVPDDPMAALVAWVERGEAPDVLPATTSDGTMRRDICRYPLVSRYDGHGDPHSPTSFRCARTF